LVLSVEDVFSLRESRRTLRLCGESALKTIHRGDAEAAENAQSSTNLAPSTTRRAGPAVATRHRCVLRFDTRNVRARRARALPGSCDGRVSPKPARYRLACNARATRGNFRATHFSSPAKE